VTTTSGVSTATFSLTVPATLQSLQATYAGDQNYSASTSPPVTVTVSKLTTTTTLAVTGTPTARTPNTTYTFVATVAPSATTPALTGTVSFYDGITLLGTAPVTSGTSSDTATLPVALANSASHSITAVYSGDSNWSTSTSSAVALATTLMTDTVTLSANVSTAGPGASVILTATVTPSAVSTVEANPKGNVVFYNGTTIIGTAPLVAAPPGDTSVATLSLATLPGGSDTIHADYLGDFYYIAGVSNYVPLNIESFTITPVSNTPVLTIVKGNSGSASFIVAGLGGFGGTVQVVCAVPTQDDMTCTPTPQDVTPSTTTPVNFVIQTYVTGKTTGANRGNQSLPRVVGGTALAILGFFLLPPFRRRARLLAEKSASQNTRRFLILLLLLAGLGGVGIGCSNSTPVSTGTPLGETQLTITATDYVSNTVVSQSVYLPVNVVANP
jgi:hypothetical protein